MTPNRPYVLGDAGAYWWYDWIVTLSPRTKSQLINSLADQSMAIDLRNAKINFAELWRFLNFKFMPFHMTINYCIPPFLSSVFIMRILPVFGFGIEEQPGKDNQDIT